MSCSKRSHAGPRRWKACDAKKGILPILITCLTLSRKSDWGKRGPGSHGSHTVLLFLGKTTIFDISFSQKTCIPADAICSVDSE